VKNDNVETITILGGRGKNGVPEPVKRIDLCMGDAVSIVGPTGSGKTTLINDIELFAVDDTPTGRRILINGEPAPEVCRNDPSRNPIALITQHTTFLSDLPVEEFLATHARIRAAANTKIAEFQQRTLDFANQLTGEPILVHSRMTELSGGGCMDVSSGRFDSFARRRHSADPGRCGARGSHFVGRHHARTSCMAGVGNCYSRHPLCRARPFGASVVEQSPTKGEFALWPLKSHDRRRLPRGLVKQEA
jgi:energy-coupling factor transporter ATP-binding protein EcfA2